MSGSFISEGDQRVDARGAAGGNETSAEADEKQEHRNGDKGEWIGGLDAQELIFDDACEGEAAENADNDSTPLPPVVSARAKRFWSRLTQPGT